MLARFRLTCCAAALLLAASVAAGAQTTARFIVTGAVLDQTGAVLQGAAVDLVGTGGEIIRSTQADARGMYRFDDVPAGQYEVRAAVDGFKPAAAQVRVGPRAPAPQNLVLSLANLKQDITVTDQEAQVDTRGSNNQDALTVDSDLLEGLPIFDQDVVGTVSRFLDAGSIGTSGVTVVVNGMEVSGLSVSASAIQQIKINQDPYSAEYSRPGRGRIEILTKPGSQEYHGEANATFRDARLNARNPFAQSRPAEQRRIFEGVLSGPFGGGGKTSFALSGSASVENQEALVFALGLSGAIHDAVPQGNHRYLLSMGITRQVGQNNTISIRPALNYERNQNRDAGGTTLASAATTFDHREQQITYTHQTIIRPTLVHQIQILAGHELEPITSASSAPGIVVAGAFTGGGAQADLGRTERHIQLMESLTWTSAHHLVQTGFQLPDWSRRGFFDTSNFGGTFYFADLNAYAAGRPYAFIQQRGNGDVILLDKQVGVYVKDDWQVRPGFTASFGMRYDWQNYFHDSNNVAPRLSVAYSPGKSKTYVFRAGAGIFNDRGNALVVADVLHSRPGGLVRYVVTNPAYPDPFVGAASALAQPPSIVQLSPNVVIPQTLQYTLGVDRQLQKGTTLSVTYTGSHGYNLFRSRDINAPAPPLYLTRPDSSFGAIREIESDGRQRTDSVQVSLRGRLTRWFNGQTQYTWSRAYNNTNGIGWYQASDYDSAGEWARADFDRRHRLVLLGRVNAGGMADIGVGLTLNSGAPYSATLGQDIYNNGRGGARPAGMARNTFEGDGYADFDLRASRDLKLGKGKDAREVTVALDAFNLLNRVNYTTYVGTLGSPLFGRPVGARDPRQLQLSLRMKF